MAKAKDNKLKLISGVNRNLLDEVQDHQADSATWLKNIHDNLDDKEALVIAKLEDSKSKKTRAKVHDPRLATIVLERVSRVMYQLPLGKAYAVSKNDIGKNIIMNMLLKHFEKNANEQYSYLMKLRMMDFYSLVYGTMWGLVPWRVNQNTGYIGPELLVLPFRDCFPQPGIRNLDEADWFTVRTITSIDYLKNQDPEYWDMEQIKKLDANLKAKKSTGATANAADQALTSYIQRNYFPSNIGDAVYPRVELYTEYRRDKWITWAPRDISDENSLPYVLRVVENPYPDGMLPIVDKHAFPLIDSPIGLGEFERGKSLQYGIDSLINLYLSGVEASIFPPLAVNVDGVVPSTIKHGAGNLWMMDHPGVDVQPVILSPQGLNTFHSTYGFMISALLNQAGTSDVTQSSNTQESLGKTPAAVQYTAARESARDEWDIFQMDETIKKIYARWIPLTTHNLETDVAMRIKGPEIEEVKKQYKDAVTLFKSETRGEVKITKKLLNDKADEPTHYDYEYEPGSTARPDAKAEQQNITEVLKAILEHPEILEAYKMKGKTVDVAALFSEWIKAGGVVDVDKVVVNLPKEKEGEVPTDPSAEQIAANAASVNQVIDPQTGAVIPPEVAPGMVPGAPQPAAAPNFNDPDIANLANEIMGGTKGIPVA